MHLSDSMYVSSFWLRIYKKDTLAICSVRQGSIMGITLFVNMTINPICGSSKI